MQNNQTPSEKRPSLKEIIVSVLAAFVGIQKDANRKRDFTYGNPWIFVVAGIIGVTIFVLILVFVVKMVLS